MGVYAFWTQMILVHREFGVILLALSWLCYKQIPELIASVRKQPDAVPSDLLLAQLRGCISGPMAYFASRKWLQKIKEEISC
ncbi:MAG: hypothetical protein ACM65M_22965 [Microcoleus sp.]